MKKRIPTLDNFILENEKTSQIYEKKFNWDAKKLAKAWNEAQPDREEPYEPSDPEVTIWVSMTNILNIAGAEPIQDYPDEYSIITRKDERFVSIYAEMEQKDSVTLIFNMVKPEDPDDYENEIKKGHINPDELDMEPNCHTETLSYDLTKMNARATIKQIDKIFKKLFVIL